MNNHIAARLRNHRLYADFQWVEKHLREHQFVCWLAGGAVRDFILGREVVEFDLVTDASTEGIKKIFTETVLVGESFGVIKVRTPSGEIFDLATFREESDYRDGRRPSLVQSSIPTRDMQRRDFTINSLYWDDLGGRLQDFCGGLADLRIGQLRAVGDAAVRFSEDYLRLLRLARFAAQLNFSIEPQTEQAALERCEKISLISGERIWAELCKIKDSDSWQRAGHQRLFGQLLKQLFQVEDQRFESQSGVDRALLFIERVLPEQDVLETLRLRLKVSRRELRLYSAYRLLRRLSERGELAQFVFEIEKSETVSEAYVDLKRGGLLTEKFIFESEKMLKLKESPLLKAEEMMGFVPAHRLGEELKDIRIKQLNGLYKTKAQVVEHLRKKYAEKTEKT